MNWKIGRICLALAFGFYVILTLSIVKNLFYIEKTISFEEVLIKQIGELQLKLQYMDSIYRANQEDVRILTEVIAGTRQTNDSQVNNNMLIRSLNMSGFLTEKGLQVHKPPIRLLSSYQFLPHLMDDTQSLRPAYLMSRGRTGVSIVFGVPTVYRRKQNYLISTLQSLINGMNTTEAEESLIIVYIGETKLKLVLKIAKEIELQFAEHLDSGLIEIISPRPSYYPRFKRLRLTLGDSYQRVRWRSKQNLDYAYLMLYAQWKGIFYVQLEDDIIAKPNYVSIMQNFALTQKSRKQSWFILDFCTLGFIGKMFKSAELKWLIQFLQLFYNDKPVDWLIYNLISTKLCSWDELSCRKTIESVWIRYRPSLFQHMGKFSSLPRKIQNLKDYNFEQIPLFYPHTNNPSAEIETDIVSYQNHTLIDAYRGKTFFWGLKHEIGNYLLFEFPKPIFIERYLFRSGNEKYPTAKLFNTTVEVFPSQIGQFVVVGSFDQSGVAEGSVNKALGQILKLRLNIHSNGDNFHSNGDNSIILSEIHIQDKIVSWNSPH